MHATASPPRPYPRASHLALLSATLLFLTLSLEATADPIGTLVTHSIRDLPKIERTALLQRLGPEWSDVLMKNGLDPDTVIEPDYPLIDAILELAVKEHRDILDLLTRPELAAPGSPAFLLDAGLLKKIDAKYNLHSIWQIRAQPQGRPSAALHMRFMLIGQGLLIIGYPESAVVEVGETEDLAEYRYEPMTLATLVNSKGLQGLYQLKTLRSEHSEFGGFIGPMGSTIKAYQVMGDKIRVSYTFIVEQEMDVPRKPIEIRARFRSVSTHARGQPGAGGS